MATRIPDHRHRRARRQNHRRMRTGIRDARPRSPRRRDETNRHARISGRASVGTGSRFHDADGADLPISLSRDLRWHIARSRPYRAMLQRNRRAKRRQCWSRAASTIDFADLAATLDLEVIVVVGNRPGCIDATTLAIQRCESRALKIAGYILCDCDPTSEIDDGVAAANYRDVSYLGRMRHREPLAKSIVEKLV